MRGLKAKQLRREAQAVTIGLPAGGYVLDGRARSNSGAQGRTKATKPGTTRASYLMLKKGQRFHGALSVKQQEVADPKQPTPLYVSHPVPKKKLTLLKLLTNAKRRLLKGRGAR